MQEKKILKEEIVTSNKYFLNLLNIILLTGSLAFFIAGISSYLNYNIINLIDSKKIVFFPQGLTMCFYGILGTIISINQIIMLKLKVGEGYNEFNKENGKITIFRKKGWNEKENISLTYEITDILRDICIFSNK